jgi:hypothetical protein
MVTLGQVEGGIDFSLAERDPDTGRLCVLEERLVETMVKKPTLECTHRWKGGKSCGSFLCLYLDYWPASYFGVLQ